VLPASRSAESSVSLTPEWPVTITGIRKDKTLADLAKQFEVHPNQITEWKRQR
jgi:hypothetical protein